MKYRCKCGDEIPYVRGKCLKCKDEEAKKKIAKAMAREEAKTHNTIEWGIGEVKKYSDQRMWCSNHSNCFRCSFGKSETPLHRDTKYNRWKYHKELGRAVFCEMNLKSPYGTPDLIIVDKGYIWIEEIVVSEKKISLESKKRKYPWPVNIIYAKPSKDINISKFCEKLNISQREVIDSIKKNPIVYQLMKIIEKNDIIK